MAESVLILGCNMQDYDEGEFKPIAEFDERWGINNCWCDFHQQADSSEKLTAIIAMDDLRRDRGTHPRYVEQIIDCDVPIYTATAYPEYSNTIDYPTEDVMEWVAPARLDNSINYALALAIHGGATTIGLFGCEFTKADPEWVHGRDMGPFPDWFSYYQEDAIFHRRGREPGVEVLNYLLGRAIERGIDVLIPRGSTIFDSDRPFFHYGYQVQP